MTLDEYFGSWIKVIDKQELFKVVDSVREIYKTKSCEPAFNNIFRAFHITPYTKLKIVSLAYDPYPQKGISTGVCFANKKDSVNLSPSLEVLKEAIINFEISHNLINFDVSLEDISKQGVLFLNSALTVETNKTGSHLCLWRPFISSFLKKLSLYNPGLIYILWGSTAKSFKSYIAENNIIYKIPHPAYYARTNTKIDSKFFRELNDVVYYQFGERIKWFEEEKYIENEEVCNCADG